MNILKWICVAGLISSCAGAEPGHRLIPEEQIVPLAAKAQADFKDRWENYLSRADQMCDPQSSGYADLDKYLLAADASAVPAGHEFQTRGHQLARYLIDWMQTLGTAYRFSDDVKYRDFAIGILIRCAESVTVDSSYIAGGFPGVRGDMMRALATGYDFFAADLTPEQRALVLKTSADYMNDYIQSAQDLPVWWRPYHNFTGVCGGAAGWVALQQIADGTPGADDSLKQIIALVEDWLDKGFDKQGAYYEGVGYSAYALENVVLFADLLKRSGGKNLFENPTLKRVIDYYVFSALPGEKLLDARNDSLYTNPGELLLKLAVEEQSGVANWLYSPLTSPKEKRTWSKGAGGSFFLEFLWANDVPRVSPEQAGFPLAQNFEGRGLCVWRTGWDKEDVMFSVEAGKYYPVTHNQADKGHFTLYSHGRRWACDLGYANNKDPKGRAQTVAHNCVLIDGKGQALSGAGAGTSGRILAYTNTPVYGYALADCTDAYRQSYTVDDQTGGEETHPHMSMDHAYRHTFFVRPNGKVPAYAVVLDDIQKDDAEHDYTWQMLSWPDLRFDLGKSGATLLPRKGKSSEKMQLWIDAAAPVEFREDAYAPGDSFKPSSYPRLRAVSHAVNPRFAVVMLPSNCEVSPSVTFEKNPQGKIVVVEWADRTDRLVWTGSTVQFAQTDKVNLTMASLFTDHMVLQQNTPVPVWGRAPAGSVINVDFAGQTKTAVTDFSNHWKLFLDPMPASSKPRNMIIRSSSGGDSLELRDVLIGEVWLCSGQSNMELGLANAYNGAQELAAADYPEIRLFAVPRTTAREPQDRVNAFWSVCTPESAATVGSGPPNEKNHSFSAVAYFFGRQLHRELNVPIGLIQTAFGGTPAEAWTQPAWLDQNGLSSINESWRQWDAETEQYNESMKQWLIASAEAEKKNGRIPPKPVKPGLRAEQYRPGSLYNAMLAPLVPFSIRGVIWYQGESNTGVFREYRKKYTDLYSDLFATTIADWRHLWGNEELPFYFVQIAPWNYKDPNGRVAAALRESQLEVFKKTPNTGIVITTDIGDVDNIHPLDKQDVGDRLARWALAKSYGRNVEYSGPIYTGFEKEDSAIRVKFDQVDGGLVFKDGPATCWEIAGKNQVFYPAKALVEGDSVIVLSENVSDPAAVRFGFTNASQPNFFNGAGLPASPFRTDRWPVTP